MSHFSTSTACSSPTSTTLSSPTSSPTPQTSSTLSPHSNHCSLSRWPPLSDHGLPRLSNTSLYSHRFTPSTAATPIISPSPLQQPLSARFNADEAPQISTHTTGLGLSTPTSTEEDKGARSTTVLRRLGRSVGKSLRRCSGCFKKQAMELEEVPGPMHWSEYEGDGERVV